jgi:hypothetical protein
MTKSRADEPDPTEDHDDEAEASAPDDDESPEPEAPRAPARAPEGPRFTLTTLVAVSALVGAGAFAAGRSFSPPAPETPAPAAQAPQGGGPLPGNAPPLGQANDLPPGHPPMGEAPPGMGGGMPPGMGAPQGAEPAQISWKVPARWQTVPNPSTMRIATYRVPHAPGDSEDPEVAVSQAGGTVEANAKRWMGQFGPEGEKNAKKSTRTVKGLAVTLVEVEGKYTGGMGKDGREEENWAMLGAIVETQGMPHFVKMTGPVKSVKAARAELDELLASITPKEPSK